MSTLQVFAGAPHILARQNLHEILCVRVLERRERERPRERARERDGSVYVCASVSVYVDSCMCVSAYALLSPSRILDISEALSYYCMRP